MKKTVKITTIILGLIFGSLFFVGCGDDTPADEWCCEKEVPGECNQTCPAATSLVDDVTVIDNNTTIIDDNTTTTTTTNDNNTTDVAELCSNPCLIDDAKNGLCVYHGLDGVSLGDFVNVESAQILCKTDIDKGWHVIKVVPDDSSKEFKVTLTQDVSNSVFGFQVVGAELAYISYKADVNEQPKVVYYDSHYHNGKKGQRQFETGGIEYIVSSDMKGVIETYTQETDGYEFTLVFKAKPEFCASIGNGAEKVPAHNNDVEVIKSDVKVVDYNSNIIFAYFQGNRLEYAKYDQDYKGVILMETDKAPQESPWVDAVASFKLVGSSEKMLITTSFGASVIYDEAYSWMKKPLNGSTSATQIELGSDRVAELYPSKANALFALTLTQEGQCCE